MSSQPTAARVIRFGLFELDLQTSELRKQGRNIKLQDQPFQVFVLLLRHLGEVVTREELRNALWSADTFIEFDQGLNTAIKKIRLALGDAADNPRFIETIPRKGYRFIASLDGDVHLAIPTVTKPQRRIRSLWVAGALAVIAITGVAGWLLGMRSRPPEAGLVAHEMGHLLLGARSHSAIGIMHVPWRVKELEIIAQGLMLFTPAEAGRMRTNVRVRIAAAEAIEQQ